MSRHLGPPTNTSLSEVAAAGHNMMRVAPLLGISSVLRERGLDPAKVLASIGLDPRTLDDGNNTIAYHSGGQLLQRCSEVTGCVHFGLLVGQKANLTALGLLGELMRRSPTVRAALRSLILHMHLRTRGGLPTHAVEGESATLGYAIYQRDMPGATQAYDLAMAFEFNILRSLCGSRWCSDEVSFSHARPKDVRPYLQYFRTAPRFDAARTAIVFGRSWLEHAPPGSDSKLHRALEREIAKLEMLAPEDKAEQVRRALRAMLMNGKVSESMISKVLSISTRTLHRLLAAQGTTFRQLLEDVRYEIARQLLIDSEMTPAEIADVLDYADATAFTRAFRRWTDSPPAAWRAKRKAGARTPGIAAANDE